jgi:hypothetical protein
LPVCQHCDGEKREHQKLAQSPHHNAKEERENRGYHQLHMACVAEDRRMQKLARKFDAELSSAITPAAGLNPLFNKINADRRIREANRAAPGAAVGGPFLCPWNQSDRKSVAEQ